MSANHNSTITLEKICKIPSTKTYAEFLSKIKDTIKELPSNFTLEIIDQSGKLHKISDQATYQNFLKFSVFPSKISIKNVTEELKKPSEAKKLESSTAEFEFIDTSEVNEDSTDIHPKIEEKKEIVPEIKQSTDSTQTNVPKLQDNGTDPTKIQTEPKSTNTEKTKTEEKGLEASPDQKDKEIQAKIQKADKKPKEESKKKLKKPKIPLRIDVCFLCGDNVQKTCEICKGTGKIRPELQKHIMRLIATEIEILQKLDKKVSLETNPELKSQYIINPAYIAPKTEHVGKTCAFCKMSPIIGVRFKCTICNNFDMCEACEAVIEHKHPKIKYREIEPKSVGDLPKKEDNKKHQNYYSKFLWSSIGPNFEATPKEIVNVTFTMQNTGDTAWPTDTVLQMCEETKKIMSAEIKPIGEVKPMQEIKVDGKLIMPNSVAKYMAFFELSHSNGKKFGQKICLEINVVPAKSALHEEEKKPEIKKLQESTMEEKREYELVMRLSQIKIPTEYYDNVLQLARMYVTVDPQKILDLLKTNKNNVEIVADYLLNEAK